MAYNLSASLSSSSSSSSSLTRETHPFCNFISSSILSHPRTRNNFNFPFKPHSKNRCLLRISSKIDLQEPEIMLQSQDQEKPDRNDASPPKPRVRVNPRSPTASKPKQKPYNHRYDTLTKLAESLNSCVPTAEDVAIFLSVLGDKIIERDAVVVLNNMSNPEVALLVLEHFLQKLNSLKKVVVYNVTLKLFRKRKDLEGAQKLFDEMLERGVEPDSITFSTLITCARQCSIPEKAVEWYEKMPAYGLEPNGLTCSLIIDSYARVGKVDVALALYDRARIEKWNLYAVTFSTLIRIYGSMGDFDGCLNLYEEMKALQVPPNASVYNSLFDAMGLAKRPWKAKNIHRAMMENGVEPTWATYAALIRAYARARYAHEALNVYREMKEKGLEPNIVLYNTLLSMCADAGFADEAFAIFKDMKDSGTCRPDDRTFSSLITLYCCDGQLEDAEAALTEMLGSGFEPNIFVLTSMAQCYGKAGRTDDVVKTFDRLLGLGIAPDERFLGCMLHVSTRARKEDFGELTRRIEKANPKLARFLNLLVDEENVDQERLNEEAGDLFGSIGIAVRKAYLNCMIDLCVNTGQLERACGLLKFGLRLGIYANLTAKTETMWALHLRGLSIGAASAALGVWVDDLSSALESGVEFPNLLGINTGHGKHRFSDKGLVGLVEARIKELGAPFHDAPDRVGWFKTTKVAAVAWLESRRSQDV